MKNMDLLVTLWPTFDHFERFAKDERLRGIRLNGAKFKPDELEKDFATAYKAGGQVPFFYDVKGRQLRIAEVSPNKNHLELKLNRPISVKTPTEVLFKAGEDSALLEKVVDGTYLIFRGGPYYMVEEGDSLHIRDPSLKVGGPILPEVEIEKTILARKAGFDKFLLSYVEEQRDIDNFREYVGDSEVIAKIENKNGLEYVAREFKKKDNLSLMAACGDLYVEIDKPHKILDALKFIIRKDPEGYIGSRMLLSLVDSPVPSFADIGHLGWLYDNGYRKFMLCDELCLKENLLGRAVNVFDSFRNSYAKDEVSSSRGGRFNWFGLASSYRKSKVSEK